MSNKNWLILFLCCLFFTALFVPYLNSVPYLDGNIDFVQTHDFFTGGFSKYFQNWASVHPPLKIVLASIFYTFFGFGVFAYNLFGLLLGLLGILGMFGLVKKYNDKTTVFAILFLATSPLFWATSLFSLTDFMLSVWLICAFFCYVRKKIIATTFFAFLAVMTKETGLLLPLVLIVTELIFLFFDTRKGFPKVLQNIFFFSLPLVGYWLWGLFAKYFGKGGWSDWIFTETARKGSFYTIFYNLITFEFLNKYAYQNWWQLLLVNSNWVYLIIIAVLSVSFLFLKQPLFHKKDVDLLKPVLSATLFCLAYFFTVLSFQTYTITRYGLPVVVLIYFLTAVILGKFPYHKISIALLMVLLVVNITSLFRSVDYLALQKWGTISVLGQRFYNLPANLAGNDGITYNFSFLKIVAKRSQVIYQADKEQGPARGDCYWIFPDPNNDYKTLKNLGLKIPTEKPCE